LLNWRLLRLRHRRDGCGCVFDAHSAFVDLGEVVIFDGAGGSGRFRVNHGCSSQELTELIRIKRGFDQRSTFAKQLLKVLARHYARVDVLHLKLALRHGALN
jgi:hypothetical protein